MATRMLQRRGTAAEWAASNPVLADGEIGYERDTKTLKVGDGVTPWATLRTTWLDQSIINAKGDLLVGSADDTPVRLPIGGNGTLLIADDTQADGLAWGNVVRPVIAGDVGLIVRGRTGQSNNLQQWEDDAAVAQAWIGSEGSFRTLGDIHANGAVFVGNAAYYNGSLNVIPRSTGEVAIVVRGIVGINTSLQVWEDETGLTVANVWHDGTMGPSRTGGGQTHRIQVGSWGSIQDRNLGADTGSADSYGTFLSYNAYISNQASNTWSQNNPYGDKWRIEMRGPNLRIGYRPTANGSAETWNDAGWTDIITLGLAGGASMVVKGNIGLANQPGTNYLNDTGVYQNRFQAGGDGNVPLVIMRHTSSQSAPLLMFWNEATGTIAQVTASGNVQGTGAYTTLSDISSKENVKALELDPFTVLRRLRPIHYDYIDGEKDQVGFIAQDVAKILPHAVVPFDTDLKTGLPTPNHRLGLRNDAILAYLVAAVQQLLPPPAMKAS